MMLSWTKVSFKNNCMSPYPNKSGLNACIFIYLFYLFWPLTNLYQYYFKLKHILFINLCVYLLYHVLYIYVYITNKILKRKILNNNSNAALLLHGSFNCCPNIYIFSFIFSKPFEISRFVIMYIHFKNWDTIAINAMPKSQSPVN